MHKHFIIIIIVSAFFGLINYNSFVMNSEPGFLQAFSSILFIILWLGYGMLGAKSHPFVFLFYLTCYFGVGAFLLVFGIFAMFFVYYPVAIVFTIPIYGGIRYFFDIMPSLRLEMLSILLLYVSCLCGYLLRRIYMILNYKKGISS
ncbi:MAG: hypothetical protein ACK4M9_22645 [Anaerobacillus sp.]|uniref:hypothetical protein n=1 Tax=Anaerobacillus sp. TaxID=1872506 RepID=UPI00391D5699